MKKHLLILALGFITALILNRTGLLNEIVLNTNLHPIARSIFSGFLFSSTFTASTGAFLLAKFSQNQSASFIALTAGAGGMLCDLLIFHIIKSKQKTLHRQAKNLNHFSILKKLVHFKKLSWTLPIVGACIIASPLPDEVGVGLIGITRISYSKFLLLSYIVNVAGMFLFVKTALIVS